MHMPDTSKSFLIPWSQVHSKGWSPGVEEQVMGKGRQDLEEFSKVLAHRVPSPLTPAVMQLIFTDL
jgi:hypothetical protein